MSPNLTVMDDDPLPDEQYAAMQRLWTLLKNENLQRFDAVGRAQMASMVMLQPVALLNVILVPAIFLFHLPAHAIVQIVLGNVICLALLLWTSHWWVNFAAYVAATRTTGAGWIKSWLLVTSHYQTYEGAFRLGDEDEDVIEVVP
jgi:hypothetical protein